MSLREKAQTFPKKPGVYLFKGAGDEVLYVGKAKILKNRISSYFGKGADSRPQVKFLIRRAKNIEFIVTDSEREALLLENTLIKKYRPKYNFELKDDKSYVSIRIGTDHEYPGIRTTRNIKRDGATYFGPYDSSLAAREAVEQIIKFFKVRSCKDREFANRVRPCLKRDIGRCTAPCVELVTKDEYEDQIEEARLFLSGKSTELIKRLRIKMKKASEDMLFEDAARMRDAVKMLRDVIKKQKVVKHQGGDHDAIALCSEGGMVTACILKVRGGLLIDRKAYFSASTIGEPDELMGEILLSYYTKTEDVPSKIFISIDAENLEEIKNLIGERISGGIKIRVPKRGPMFRLVELARTNASEFLEHKRKKKGDADIIAVIGRKLGFSDTPELIDCIDISNLNGREAVGSIVSFRDGAPDKGRYRTYHIRSLETPDDYAMMEEVLIRRYGENTSLALPDLLLVDGGKGQLAVAVRVMREGKIALPIAAIAKGKKEGESDRIFIPGRKNHLNFKPGSKELLFLMRIRDEAHRFGINAHRRRRSRKATSPPL